MLRLYVNYFTGAIPLSIGNITTLTELTIGNNLLNGTVPYHLFDNLTSLEYFYAGYNILTGRFPSTAGVPSLKFIDVRNNSFSGTLPEELADLSALLAVDLGMNLFYGTLPASLTRLQALEYIE